MCCDGVALVKPSHAAAVPQVFTGLWRLGYSSGAAALGVVPDIACYAKLLTGGLVPLGAVLATGPVFDAFQGEHRSRCCIARLSMSAHLCVHVQPRPSPADDCPVPSCMGVHNAQATTRSRRCSTVTRTAHTRSDAQLRRRQLTYTPILPGTQTCARQKRKGGANTAQRAKRHADACCRCGMRRRSKRCRSAIECKAQWQ